MQRLLMLLVSGVLAIHAASAVADSSDLRGTYGFTGTDACLYASGRIQRRTASPRYHLFII
jgi:hypothetical protein